MSTSILPPLPQQQEAKEQLTPSSFSLSSVTTAPPTDKDSFVYEEVEIDDNTADTDAIDALLDQPISELSDSGSEEEDGSLQGMVVRGQRAVQQFLVGLKAYKQHKAQQTHSLSQLPLPLLPPLTRHSSTAAASRPTTAAQPSIDTFAYISSLLARTNLPNSLAVFQTEWNDSLTANPLAPALPADLTPDLHLNTQLHTQLEQSTAATSQLTGQLTQLTHSLHSLRHQRDYHRLHHRRVIAEKSRLERDLKRLESHYREYEPLMERMKREVERGGRERTMMRMEREKMKEKVRKLEQETERLQTELRDKEKNGGGSGSSGSTADESTRAGSTAVAGGKVVGGKKRGKVQRVAAVWPPPPSPTNPFASSTVAATQSQQTPAAFSLTRTFAGHQAAVSALSFHPTRSLLLTASDDCTWKLWTAPRGELVLTGEGHRAWVSDVKVVGGGGGGSGKVVVSGSGDGLVKVWDLLEARCVSTFGPSGTDGGQVGGDNAVWSVDVHCGGEHVLASYLDGCCKVFDLSTGTVRSTLRGHVDAVNTAAFLPLSSSVLTASADHTLSLWDVRSAAAAGTAQPYATLASHTAAVMSACVTLSGCYAFSVDVSGRLLQWDLRQRRLLRAAATEAGSGGLLDVSVDCRDQWVVTGGEDGVVRCWDVADSVLSCVKELTGHEGRVDCVEWEPSGAYIVSGGADNTFRIWS